MEYDIDKEKAIQYLEYLDRMYSEWYTHPKKKDRTQIENEIRNTANFWDDTIYIWLNNGNASGLFEPGFFESDIKRALSLLKEKVNEGKVKPMNKLNTLYKILEDFKVPKEDLLRKELKDYLIEKINKGELANRKITFRNAEDYEYFSKLVSNFGVDPDGVLEEIVMSIFYEN